MLNWELFQLIFYDAENFHVRDKTKDDTIHGEKVLECACDLWEDDLHVVGNKKGIDIDGLEERVANMISTLQEDTNHTQPHNTKHNTNTANNVPAPMTSQTDSSLEIDKNLKDYNGNVAEKAAADKAFDLVSSHQMPWLLRFRSALDQITSHLPHDMLNSPTLCLFVASTSEGTGRLSVVDCLVELVNVHHLPNSYHNGLIDPLGLRKQFVILHDEIDGPKDFKEGPTLAEMHKRFGSGCCAVLRINSVSPKKTQKDFVEDPVWDNFASFSSKPTSQSQFMMDASNARGMCLSSRDKLALRRFTAQMITLGLIPSIETRIFNLNVSVTNGKKGVKNVFKSLWRKPKESAGVNSSTINGKTVSVHGVDPNSRSNGAVKYRFDSIESQTRLLADTLFLMRDFEASLGMYRLVKDDYKIDGNLFHYASVQEMMALCLHFIEPYSPRNTKEVVQYIQNAICWYTRTAEEENTNGGTHPSVASSAKRCATRLCLVLSSTRTLCESRDMKIADLLASASSSETPLGAAVLLEQSSAHYYQAGTYRKFGFHMLMAGHMFRSANQERHAIRCFTSAMYIFDGGKRRWDTLSNHLTSALAGQLYAMERMGLSLQLYARLLGSQGGGRVSIRSQQKFLDHLNEICKKHGRDAIASTEQMRLLGNSSTSERTKHETGPFDELLECTPMAERMLEIPNMQLPQIFDASLAIQVENVSTPEKFDVKGVNKPSPSVMFGTNSQGSELIWNDMMCSTEAELRVSSSSSSRSLSTEDWIQRVVSEIDAEKTNARLLERSRKSSNNGGSPSVRAQMESISVTFTVANPLGLSVPTSQIQLVARLKCASTGRVFTNEGAIHIPPVRKSVNKTKQWSFGGSSKTHEIAEFSRISPQSMQVSDELQRPWLSAFEEGVHPFFVVTKSGMVIEPGEEVNVSLGICPLVMGDLDIVGVRLKIFNEVWVYHKFKIVHPLLHNTALDRSNRMRGESYILRSKIECDMPNLFVDVVPLQDKVTKNNGEGTVLQGQISQSLLRISNRGTAPASGVLIKTNVPWISILGCKESKDSSVNGDSKETSFCMGPTGTLMRVPLGTANVLYPGQTVDIPIEVRTSGGGRQDFYMLFRYELFDATGTSSNACSTSPKLRWLRKISSIAVYPSLTVTASLMPSHLKKYDHILSIEMTNYRSDTQSKLDIILDKVCVASKRYSIKPMAGQTVEKDNKSSRCTNYTGISECGLHIGWQEQVTLHYLISPLDVDEAKCTYSQCLINGQVDSKRTTDSLVTDFICLEHAHGHFMSFLDDHQNELSRQEAEKERDGQHPRSISQIRRAGNKNEEHGQGLNDSSTRHDRTFHPTSIASLCSPQHSDSEINLICSWIATGANDTINGQHHLRQLAVRPQHRSTGCPLIISAQHESSVNHDFSQGPLNVEMEITIRNRVVQSKVDFTFSVNEQPDFEFMGTECFRWNLDGNGEMTFPLRAVIFSSGVYDLQCVKITVHQSDGKDTSYVFPLQWIIKVD